MFFFSVNIEERITDGCPEEGSECDLEIDASLEVAASGNVDCKSVLTIS